VLVAGSMPGCCRWCCFLEACFHCKLAATSAKRKTVANESVAIQIATLSIATKNYGKPLFKHWTAYRIFFIASVK